MIDIRRKEAIEHLEKALLILLIEEFEDCSSILHYLDDLKSKAADIFYPPKRNAIAARDDQ